MKLREQRNATDTESEPTRVITVRLPKSMHEYLRTEAHDLRTSMNKLCISKLLQVIEQDLIPAERSGGTPERSRSWPPRQLAVESVPPASVLLESAAPRPSATRSTNRSRNPRRTTNPAHAAY